MKWESGTDYTPERVARAVRVLTPAQRNAILHGTVGGPLGFVEGRGYWPLRNGLIARGLMTTANRIPVLTNFGRAVQAELQKEQPA